MIDWALSVVWYGSVLAMLAGTLAVVRPIRRLGLHRRSRGGAVLAVAAALLVANAVITPGTSHAVTTASPSAIDRLMPAYQFRESHARSVQAPLARVWAAVNEVTAGEIALFQAFTAVRRFGRSGPAGILNPPSDEPILAVATRTGFLLLARTETEVVVGTVVAGASRALVQAARSDVARFADLTTPGLVKAVMNFRVEPSSGGATRVTTETRVFASDEDGVRQFTPYWRTIFPGSWILRVTWLDAIARRAER